MSPLLATGVTHLVKHLFFLFFKGRKNQINHCVYLNALYLLQSIDSRNFSWIKCYDNPPKLVEIHLFFFSPLYSGFVQREVLR